MAKVVAIFLTLVVLGSTAPTSSDHHTTISTSFEKYRYTGNRENAADSVKSDISDGYREEEEEEEMMQGDQPIVSFFDYNGAARQEEEEDRGENREEARRNRTPTLEELLRRQRLEK